MDFLGLYYTSDFFFEEYVLYLTVTIIVPFKQKSVISHGSLYYYLYSAKVTAPSADLHSS